MGKPIISKYQSDWDQQGQALGCEVDCIVKIYNILVTLVVKNDQIGVHIVPMTKNTQGKVKVPNASRYQG